MKQIGLDSPFEVDSIGFGVGVIQAEMTLMLYQSDSSLFVDVYDLKVQIIQKVFFYLKDGKKIIKDVKLSLNM